MRLAVYHNHPSGGARRALYGFCRELARRHSLDVYTLTSADQAMLRDEDFASALIRVPYQLRGSVRMGLYLNDIRRAASYADLARVNARVAALIDLANYDAVLVDECRFTNAPYILDHLRTPSAYYCHHRLRPLRESLPGPPASPYQQVRDLWHRPFERRLEERLWQDDARCMRRASMVLTNSRFSADQLQRIYGIAAVVCPPGVDRPLEDERQERDYVLSVGTLEAHKGHDLVIQSLALLPLPRPGLHIIANDGNSLVRRRLESLARAGGVSLTIRILPPPSELDREYRGALVFAYGAIDEPLGLAPLEAMAYGVPVVAVGEGGVRETVLDGQTGYLVERDRHQLAARLSDLLGNSGLRSSLGRAGRRHVAAHWAWSDRAAALETQLGDLVRARRPDEVGVH